MKRISVYGAAIILSIVMHGFVPVAFSAANAAPSQGVQAFRWVIDGTWFKSLATSNSRGISLMDTGHYDDYACGQNSHTESDGTI